MVSIAQKCVLSSKQNNWEDPEKKKYIYSMHIFQV